MLPLTSNFVHYFYRPHIFFSDVVSEENNKNVTIITYETVRNTYNYQLLVTGSLYLEFAENKPAHKAMISSHKIAH